MAQTAKRHTGNKRQREAHHFVNYVLDELIACELDALVAMSQPDAATAPPEDAPPAEHGGEEERVSPSPLVRGEVR